MPGFDGTGPMGAGPMTGGGRGMCNPSLQAYAPGGFGVRRGGGAGIGPGFGRGRGYGRGFGRRGAYPMAGGWTGAGYNTPYGIPYAASPEEELSMLKNESTYIQDELNAINKRIAELEAKTPE